MKIIIDTNILIQLFQGNPSTKNNYIDPRTDSIVENISLRAQELLNYIESAKGVIIIPTPVLCEYLMGIEKKHQTQHISLITCNSRFEIFPFDELAALECARLPSVQELKQLLPNCFSNKIKFDRQIIAIAKAANVDEIWTHDKDIHKICVREGITVKSLADISPKPEQFKIKLNHDGQTEKVETVH